MQINVQATVICHQFLVMFSVTVWNSAESVSGKRGVLDFSLIAPTHKARDVFIFYFLWKGFILTVDVAQPS